HAVAGPRAPRPDGPGRRHVDEERAQVNPSAGAWPWPRVRARLCACACACACACLTETAKPESEAAFGERLPAAATARTTPDRPRMPRPRAARLPGDRGAARARAGFRRLAVRGLGEHREDRGDGGEEPRPVRGELQP